MYKYLGQGGVGDCYISIIKMKEYGKKNFKYTHIETNPSKVKMCEELLNTYKIKNEVIQVDNKVQWWNKHFKEYDMCLNVFAKGHIDIPLRPYHWEPCKDKGFTKPWANKTKEGNGKVVVQVNGGVGTQHPRSWKTRPIINYVLTKYNPENIIWVGTDDGFSYRLGQNLSGKATFKKTLSVISEASLFIGFNSVLLYHALHHKKKAILFMDHQKYHDLRIHDAWKKNLTYVEDYMDPGKFKEIDASKILQADAKSK
jgi:hypothetical protein